VSKQVDKSWIQRGRANRSTVSFSQFSTHNVDPFIPQSFSKFCGKFVFKRELIWQPPFLGGLLWAYGHVAINRANRQSAIESLNNAGAKLKKLGRSTLIFPEGTRSRNGQLLPFKKG
jgi:1-acyl-sn-glycerol-3-phosphate acyltransferase